MGIDLSEYELNPVWDIKETFWSAGDDGEDSFITFSIKLQRHASYFMLNVFFPIFVLAILNVCVFLLPCESGEKNSYAVTVFLSFAIFLTIVNSSLPQNADKASVFQIYMLLLTFQSTVITVISLLLSRLISFDEKQIAIPLCILKLSRLIRFCNCWKRKQTRRQSVKLDDVHGSRVSVPEADEVIEQSNVENEATWATVVNGIDAVCLVFFSSVTFVLTLLFLCISPSVTATQ